MREAEGGLSVDLTVRSSEGAASGAPTKNVRMQRRLRSTFAGLESVRVARPDRPRGRRMPAGTPALLGRRSLWLLGADYYLAVGYVLVV